MTVSLKKIVFLVALVLIAYGAPSGVKAVALAKNFYRLGEPIMVDRFTNPAYAYTLYDLTSGTMLGGSGATPEEISHISWNEPFPVPNHSYSVVEVTTPVICEEVPDTYEACKARPEYVGEAKFTVGPPLASAGVPAPGSVPVSAEDATSSLSTPVVTAPSPPLGSAAPPAFPNAALTFQRDMAYGTEGDDVSRLQAILVKDPALYPEGLVTGYFGTLTERAVRRFQQKYGIVTSGTPLSTGFGRAGPRTRAKLHELIQASAPR